MKILQRTNSAYLDKRGSYWTSWNHKDYKIKFNHDKFSISKKNVLRGLHGDKKTWKLVSFSSRNSFHSTIQYDNLAGSLGTTFYLAGKFL